MDADFVDSPDYRVLAHAAATFKGLIPEGAMVRSGQGDKAKEFAIRDFREAMVWLQG